MRKTINRDFATSKDFCYLAGYSCAMTGPNEKNCHFSWFSTPEKTAHWEQGKRDAESDLALSLSEGETK